jgi:hypothetical protein
MTPHRREKLYTILVSLLLAVGCAPRIAYYMTGRALWFDEAALCINVLERGWLQLLEPMAFKQVAPPLYLWGMKLCTVVAGPTVYAVRLPSLLAGLGTLILFWIVARRLLSSAGAIMALAVVAVSQHLIVYSGEAKPYALDVAIALAVVWMALRWEDKPATWQRALRYGLLMGLAVWLSFPAVFVIGGVGSCQLFYAAKSRDWRSFSALSTVFGLAALSFLIEYVVAIGPSRGNAETMDYMNVYWRHGFMPFPPTSHWDFRWYRVRSFMFMDMPGGFTLPGLALFAWLTGLLALWNRKVRYALWLLSPVFLTLFVSIFKLYPFHGRMILFLAPALFLPMGEGLAWFCSDSRRPARYVVTTVLCFLLLTQPAVRAARMVVSPSRHHELEKVLAYADRNWQEGDKLFLRQGDYISYRFLAGRYSFPPEAVLQEPRNDGSPGAEVFFLDSIPGRVESWERVWFPMAFDSESVVQGYIEVLSKHGASFARHDARGALVYGIDFRATFPEEPPPRP